MLYRVKGGRSADGSSFLLFQSFKIIHIQTTVELDGDAIGIQIIILWIFKSNENISKCRSWAGDAERRPPLGTADSSAAKDTTCPKCGRVKNMNYERMDGQSRSPWQMRLFSWLDSTGSK
jgi:hypothetical protein